MEKPNVGQQESLLGAEDDQSPVSGEAAKPIEGTPQTPQELLNLQQQLSNLTAELRGLQGRQDRNESEVQRFMGEVKANMANGMSFEEAEKAVTESRKLSEKDALLYKMAEKLGVYPPSGPVPGKDASTTVNAAMVFEKVGLDPRDPDVVLELGKGFKSPEEAELAAYRFKDRKAAAPTPTGGQEPAVTSGGSQAPSTAALRKEYEKELSKIVRNPGAIANLKAQYRRKGLTDLW